MSPELPESLSLEACREKLRSPDLSASERVRLLCGQGVLLAELGQDQEAIASYEMALSIQPDAPMPHVYWGRSLVNLGRWAEAIPHYDQAIALVGKPSDKRSKERLAELWQERAEALRVLRRYREALQSYNQVLELQLEHWQAWSGKGFVLAALGQKRQATLCANRAMSLRPSAAEVWVSRGAIRLMAGQPKQALDDLDRALELNPTYGRAWHNRGVALMKLGREQEAIASFEQVFSLEPTCKEPWYATAWAYYGYALMRQRQFQRAIASFDHALTLDPQSYPAALYRTVCLIASGQLLPHLRQAQTRSSLWQNLKTIVGFLKFRLLILLIVITVLSFGQGAWAAFLRWLVPTLFSLGIIALMIGDLWQNRDRLHFVWRTYFQSGILTYVRAIAILTLTLTTYALADTVAPPFLRWGWASLVFGEPGNILFQPFRLFQSSPLSMEAIPNLLASLLPLQLPLAIAPFLSWSDGYIIGFWLLLILGIPFWARLEERIFRQGANTWRQIAVRSTQFGLVHLIVGIPILAGFVLIVPGFCFAWRYKFVHDRHWQRHQNSLLAQEAGVAASTADHAVYNAILVTLVTLTFVLL